MANTSAKGVVDFWREAGMGCWFAGGTAFDARCRDHLGEAHLAAARRELDDWAANPEGSLALLLLLDQIPRNIYRDSGHAFASDGLALHFAVRALADGHDAGFEPALRAFFYLPMEHSEDADDQARAVALFEALGEKSYLEFAIAHRDVIARFGRFPHRNAALGRSNTPQEQAWLDAGGGF